MSIFEEQHVTRIVNDPLGQPHSPAGIIFIEILNTCTDEWTCENIVTTVNIGREYGRHGA